MASKLWQWYLSNRTAENVTVYYDRNRHGWFFKANDERHGYRNSKDVGYSSRAQAIEGLQRYLKKHTVTTEDVNIDDDGTINLVQSFKYNAITRRKIQKVKKDCYGRSRQRRRGVNNTPGSDSYWVKRFIEELHVNTFTVTGLTKDWIEDEDTATFSLLKLFHGLGYEPMYDENEQCIGLTDYTGGNQ